VNLSEYPDVGKVDEVAQVARYDRKTVYAAIERGELQAVRCGRAIRVTKVALLRWLGITDVESEKPTLRVVEGGG
jgi:excisionase family DNA binding protein